MTGHADEHERTLAFAEIALGQIKALRQPATPRNYEIWYAYATGYHPSLNQKINEFLNEKGVLTDADLDEIYETYLSPSRLTDSIDKVGSQVMGEIEQVMAMIDAAAGSANSYTESLHDMSEKLGDSKDREGLRAIVEGLVQTAKSVSLRVFLATIPPERPGGRNAGNLPSVVPYNNALKNIAASAGVPLVDVYNAFNGDLSLIGDVLVDGPYVTDLLSQRIGCAPQPGSPPWCRRRRGNPGKPFQ